MRCKLILLFLLLSKLSVGQQWRINQSWKLKAPMMHVQSNPVTSELCLAYGTDSTIYILSPTSVNEIKTQSKIINVIWNKAGNAIIANTNKGQITYSGNNFKTESLTTSFINPKSVDSEGKIIFLNNKDTLFSLYKTTLLSGSTTLASYPITGIHVSTYGDLVIASGLSILIVSKEGVIRKIYGPSNKPVTHLTLSSDGKTIISKLSDRTVEFRDYASGTVTGTVKPSSKNTEADNGGVSMSPDNKWLITAGNENYIILWDANTLSLNNYLYGHTNKVNDVSFSMDGKLFYSASDDSTVKIWIPVVVENKLIVADNSKTQGKDSVKKDTLKPISSELTFDKTNSLTEINGRKVVVKPTTTISSRSVMLYIWDADMADSDIVSLNLNGKWILENYQLQKLRKGIRLNIDPLKPNYLVLYAVTDGRLGPNTAGIALDDGFGEKKLTLRSDLHTSEAVKILLR